MSKYRTCHNCAVNPAECPTRARLTSALAGMNVTSVKHRCPDRKQLFQSGERVSVSWVVPGGDGYDEYADATEETWPATVIAEKGSKFIICVDDVDSDCDTPARDYLKNPSLYAKVTVNKLKPLDEPKRAVCELCGIVENNGFAECWQQGTVPHSKCLRASTDSMTKPTPRSPRHGGNG